MSISQRCPRSRQIEVKLALIEVRDSIACSALTTLGFKPSPKAYDE